MQKFVAPNPAEMARPEEKAWSGNSPQKSDLLKVFSNSVFVRMQRRDRQRNLLRIWTALVEEADRETLRTRPTHAVLAERVEVHQRTVGKFIRVLHDAGWLRVIELSSRNRGVEYQLRLLDPNSYLVSQKDAAPLQVNETKYQLF